MLLNKTVKYFIQIRIVNYHNLYYINFNIVKRKLQNQSLKLFAISTSVFAFYSKYNIMTFI